MGSVQYWCSPGLVGGRGVPQRRLDPNIRERAILTTFGSEIGKRVVEVRVEGQNRGKISFLWRGADLAVDEAIVDVNSVVA
jgi:hypothetical protein